MEKLVEDNPEMIGEIFLDENDNDTSIEELMEDDGILIDGGNGVHSDECESDEDIMPRRKKVRPIDEDNSDSSEDNINSDCNETEANNEDMEETDPTVRKIEDEAGRLHIATGRTGSGVIFLGPNSYKPSSIEAHENDLLTIFEAKPELKKNALILMLDDGDDYGIRTEETLIYMRKLMVQLNVDFVMVVKYAPGQSRRNPIEHLWAPVTRKLSSVILYPQGDRDEDGDDDEEKRHGKMKETDDDYVETVKCLMKDFNYDGYKVETVAMKGETNDVTIEGKIYKNLHINELEAIKSFMKKPVTKSRMKHVEGEDKKYLNELNFTVNHMDRRGHRKCLKVLGEKVCSWCKQNPPRSSKAFLKALPPRQSGGLFFAPQPDPCNPEHNLTYLQQRELLKSGKLRVKPDEDLDLLRCQEEKCLYSFKSKAEARRHYCLCHRKIGAKEVPIGVSCSVCKLEFDSAWFLSKHKKQTNHFIRKNKD